MTVKTLEGFASQIARDANTMATRGASLAKHAVAYALVYAKVKERSLGTGFDFACGAIEAKVDEHGRNYIKKALSHARACIYSEAVKKLALQSTEEADMIAEAVSICDKLDVRAIVEARIKSNAGSKGGRKAAEPKAEPTAAVTGVTAPAPAIDPVLAAETEAAQCIAALIEAGATEALGRLMTMMAQAELAKKAA